MRTPLNLCLLIIFASSIEAIKLTSQQQQISDSTTDKQDQNSSYNLSSQSFDNTTQSTSSSLEADEQQSQEHQDSGVQSQESGVNNENQFQDDQNVVNVQDSQIKDTDVVDKNSESAEINVSSPHISQDVNVDTLTSYLNAFESNQSSLGKDFYENKFDLIPTDVERVEQKVVVEDMFGDTIEKASELSDEDTVFEQQLEYIQTDTLKYKNPEVELFPFDQVQTSNSQLNQSQNSQESTNNSDESHHLINQNGQLLSQIDVEISTSQMFIKSILIILTVIIIFIGITAVISKKNNNFKLSSFFSKQRVSSLLNSESTGEDILNGKNNYQVII